MFPRSRTRKPTIVSPAECLGGLQTMQTLNQHKVRAVRPHQDRRLLAVVSAYWWRFPPRASVRAWCAALSATPMSAIAKVSRFIMIKAEDSILSKT